MFGRSKLKRIATIKDLESNPEVLNLDEVEKYGKVVEEISKYLKQYKYQVGTYLANMKADEGKVKYFRLGTKDCVIEIRIME